MIVIILYRVRRTETQRIPGLQLGERDLANTASVDTRGETKIHEEIVPPDLLNKTQGFVHENFPLTYSSAIFTFYHFIFIAITMTLQIDMKIRESYLQTSQINSILISMPVSRR